MELHERRLNEVLRDLKRGEKKMSGAKKYLVGL